MDESDLRVVIMAGPNGSGKTSLIENLLKIGHLMQPPIMMPSHVINPDKVRQSPEIISLTGSGQNLDQAAQKLAYQQRQALIAAKQPFAFETVMSHPSRLVELQQLRDQGYSVCLTFITTKSPDINVDRVKFRVQSQSTTGHDVPEKNVRERYHRTLDLLPAAIELASQTFLFDNSYFGFENTQQAYISTANLAVTGVYDVHATQSPEEWVSLTLDRITDRAAQRTAIAEVAVSARADAYFANPVEGTYRGELIACGSDYFGLLDTSSDQARLSIHDRLMLVPEQKLLLQAQLHDHAGLHTEIIYSPNQAPTINYSSQSDTSRIVDVETKPNPSSSASRPR